MGMAYHTAVWVWVWVLSASSNPYTSSAPEPILLYRYFRGYFLFVISSFRSHSQSSRHACCREKKKCLLFVSRYCTSRSSIHLPFFQYSSTASVLQQLPYSLYGVYCTSRHSIIYHSTTATQQYVTSFHHIPLFTAAQQHSSTETVLLLSEYCTSRHSIMPFTTAIPQQQHRQQYLSPE